MNTYLFQRLIMLHFIQLKCNTLVFLQFCFFMGTNELYKVIVFYRETMLFYYLHHYSNRDVIFCSSLTIYITDCVMCSISTNCNVNIFNKCINYQNKNYWYTLQNLLEQLKKIMPLQQMNIAYYLHLKMRNILIIEHNLNEFIILCLFKNVISNSPEISKPYLTSSVCSKITTFIPVKGSLPY